MKVHTVGKFRSEVDRAYLAGLLDGDGAIMATIERHREKRFGFRVRVEVKITQHDRNDVGWIPRLVGAGYIRQNRQTYEWIVRDQSAVAALLASLAPFVRGKKKQVALALRIVRTPIRTRAVLQRVARLADTLSSHNVRSKLRRKNYAAMIQK